MKIRILLASALLLGIGAATAQTPPPSRNIEQIRQLIDELQRQVETLETQQQEESASAAPVAETPVQPVAPIADTNGVIALDTLPTINEAVRIVIFNDNSWKYVRDRAYVRDSAVYTGYWDTSSLFPYREVALSSLPASVAIDLVDSLKRYHYPYRASVRSKYGVRRGRQHQGVDLPLKTGDPVYATFDGRVRISQYNTGGYGNLIILRHDNGLETYYGHLSERLVQPDEWVEAGQIIGYGGSTGRSTGPHLHFETRYFGQSFDPERLIDFETGLLRRQTFLLKKSFFDIRSSAAQDFSDEEANDADDKKEAAAKAAIAYHTIRSGDTLGAIARKYGTTVSRICSLNGISSTTTLRIGRKLRVR
ncbi:MAG: peptidoglycan DD-metalloendopeptidase family protein [Alistipes sp.]|nr:peptidoglycan DD-metalloendopeptidase family protein [Alistipes sp.]